MWFVEFKRGWSGLDTSKDAPFKKLDHVIRSRHLRDLKEEAIQSYKEVLTHENKKVLPPRDD